MCATRDLFERGPIERDSPQGKTSGAGAQEFGRTFTGDAPARAPGRPIKIFNILTSLIIK